MYRQERLFCGGHGIQVGTLNWQLYLPVMMNLREGNRIQSIFIKANSIPTNKENINVNSFREISPVRQQIFNHCHHSQDRFYYNVANR